MIDMGIMTIKNYFSAGQFITGPAKNKTAVKMIKLL